MKVTAEHLATIREAVAPLDTETHRERYRTGNFPRADLTRDRDKRYRWDLFHAADPRCEVLRVLYDANYHDAHIDTALRSIVPPL